MSFIFDAILAAIIIILSVKHYKQGFTKSILNFGKFFVSIILSVWLGKVIALAFEDSDLFASMPTGLGNMFCGIFGYLIAFALSFIVLTIIINLLCNIKIPILHKINKLVGLAMGFAIGFFIASALSTVFYTCLELVSSVKNDSAVMNAYSNSFVFKFIYELRIFEFIRELI